MISAEGEPSAGKLQAKARQAVPGVTRGLALDLRINLLGIHQHLVEVPDSVPLQRLAEQRLAFVPDRRAGAGKGTLLGNPLADLPGQPAQQTHFSAIGSSAEVIAGYALTAADETQIANTEVPQERWVF